MSASTSVLAAVAVVLAAGVGVVGIRFLEFVARQRGRRLKTQIAYVRAFNHSVERILSQPDTPEFALRTVDRLSWALKDDAILKELERSFHLQNPSEEDLKAHEDRTRRFHQLSKSHPLIADDLRAAQSHAISFLICRSNVLSDAMPEIAEELMTRAVDEVEKAVVKVRGANKTKRDRPRALGREIAHVGGH